uniref:Uncharacterized protein n=1 Tax=Trichogramma kaykai TaxID=54128 RepID=A0ABD2W6I1_9HYME
MREALGSGARRTAVSRAPSAVCETRKGRERDAANVYTGSRAPTADLRSSAVSAVAIRSRLILAILRTSSDFFALARRARRDIGLARIYTGALSATTRVYTAI